MLIKFNREGSPIPCPCNGCVEPKRQYKCHTFCEEYLQYKEDIKVYNDNKRMEDEKNIISDTKKDWLYRKQRRSKR